MRRARRIVVWTALALLVLPAAVWPQVPKTMHFQGVLTDDEGLPITGSVPMIFRLYADTTESAIWSQSVPAMQVKNGWYEAELDVSALPFDEPYFLQIVVSGTPLGPKKPLAGVPYAMRSARTRFTAGAGLAGSSDSSGVRIDLADGGVTTVKLADGSATASKIGAGAVTEEKIAAGAVTGPKIAPDQVVRRISGLQDNVYLEAGENVTVAVLDSTIRISATPGGGGTADADWQIAGGVMYAIPPGNVGIGTVAPASKLEVKGGDARITNGSLIVTPVGDAPPFVVPNAALVSNLNADMVDGLHASSFALTAHEHDASAITSGTIAFGRLPVGASPGMVAEGNHTHPGLGGWTVDGSDMYSEVGGNVGIGTDAPTRTFDVQGDVEVTGSIYAGDASGIGLRDHAGTIGLWVEDGGEVGIGTSATGALFDVNGTAIVRGALLVGGDNPDDNDTLGMDDETQVLFWNNASDRFEMTNNLAVQGAIAAGDFVGQVAPVAYNNFTFGTYLTPTSGQMNSSGDVYVQFDCEVGDQLFVVGTADMSESLLVGSYLTVGRDVSVGGSASNDNDAIHFDQDAEHLTWDNAQDRFELSSALAVGEPISAGGMNALLGPKHDFNCLSYALAPAPASGEMTTGGDLFVNWDFEAGDDIYYTGSLVDLAPGIPFDGGGSAEELTLAEAKSALAALQPKVIRTPDTEEGKSGEEKTKIGFLASEIPDLLKTGSNNGYRPLDIVGILTKVVQEQQATIASLEARLRALEQEGSAR